MITKKQLVYSMRIIASKGYCDGTDKSRWYLIQCKKFHEPTGTLIMFTRDIGYHSCGWFKNPDYERCYHLSLSYKGIDHGRVYPLSHNWKLSDQWVKLFFQNDRKLIWVEPPFSERVIENDVCHYRLFCDEAWQPIKPRGEVYSTEFTEKGWKSFSEIHGGNKNERGH